MSDAAIAAVSGLLGVALSGGVQVGLELRRDHKTRRAAIRPVEYEIRGIIALLSFARDQPCVIVALPQPERWRTLQELLSRELPDRKWDSLASAYNFYDTALELNDTLKDAKDSQQADQSRRAFRAAAHTAIEAMDDAHRSVSRRRWRRTGVDVVVGLPENPAGAPTEGRESDD